MKRGQGSPASYEADRFNWFQIVRPVGGYQIDMNADIHTKLNPEHLRYILFWLCDFISMPAPRLQIGCPIMGAENGHYHENSETICIPARGASAQTLVHELAHHGALSPKCVGMYGRRARIEGHGKRWRDYAVHLYADYRSWCVREYRLTHAREA